MLQDELSVWKYQGIVYNLQTGEDGDSRHHIKGLASDRPWEVDLNCTALKISVYVYVPFVGFRRTFSRFQWKAGKLELNDVSHWCTNGHIARYQVQIMFWISRCTPGTWQNTTSFTMKLLRKVLWFQFIKWRSWTWITNAVGEHLKHFVKAGKIWSVHFLNLKPNVIDAEKITKVKYLPDGCWRSNSMW